MVHVAWILIISVVVCCEERPFADEGVQGNAFDVQAFDSHSPLPSDPFRLVALFGADDWDVGDRASSALVQLGDAAIPALIEGLRRQQSFDVLMGSRIALSRIGPSAISALLDVVSNVAYDQQQVVRALALIRPSSDEVVAAFIRLLQTEADVTRAPTGFGVQQPDCICWIRSTARITVLNEICATVVFDHASKPLVPVLSTLLDDPDHRVRRQARDHLGMIDAEALFPKFESEFPEVDEVRSEPAKAWDAHEMRARQEAWSRRLGQPREIVNSIGMRMVLVPPGEFLRGSPATEVGRDDDEGPQQVIPITRAFYLGVYEVTQAEYQRVMGSNPSWFYEGGRFEARVAGMDTFRFLVETVSWPDAVEFCTRLSSFPDEQAAGRIYRLPTEAEWEYAARAGTTTPFHFGTVLTGHQANFDGRYPYGASDDGPHMRRPTVVGSYPPNALGLHDMHGNVWEWCSDWYSRTYYRVRSTEDPTGPTGYFVSRVIRGGGWNSFGRFARSAYRRRDFGSRPAYILSCDIGFRVAVSLAREPDD